MKRLRQKDVQYYTKLESSNEDTNADDDIELFARKPMFKEVPTEEKTLQDGDTLQSLSLRFHCSIAELKRLNNIHKENEIYARNTIKVPSRPFSASLAGIHTSGKSSPDSSTAQNVAIVDGDVLERKLSKLNKNRCPGTSNVDTSLNAVIFNSSVSNICDNHEDTAEGCDFDDEDHLLPTQRVIHSPESSAVNTYTCSGADADISWIALILFICILIVAVPLIYIFYIAEHPEEYHHKSHIIE